MKTSIPLYIGGEVKLYIPLWKKTHLNLLNYYLNPKKKYRKLRKLSKKFTELWSFWNSRNLKERCLATNVFQKLIFLPYGFMSSFYQKLTCNTLFCVMFGLAFSISILAISSLTSRAVWNLIENSQNFVMGSKS